MKCLSGPASAGTLFLEAEKRWGFYFAAVILTVSRCCAGSHPLSLLQSGFLKDDWIPDFLLKSFFPPLFCQ